MTSCRSYDGRIESHSFVVSTMKGMWMNNRMWFIANIGAQLDDTMFQMTNSLALHRKSPKYPESQKESGILILENGNKLIRRNLTGTFTTFYQTNVATVAVKKSSSDVDSESHGVIIGNLLPKLVRKNGFQTARNLMQSADMGPL